MLISRGFRALKQTTSYITKNGNYLNKIPKRHSSGEVGYRHIPEPETGDKVVGQIIMATMWWWVLWNCYHDWGHIVGEFDYPDPSKWTDEELGIPPDNED